MPTEVDLVNMAFRKLGEKSITALTDNLERALVANSLYVITRDEVMRAHPWRCLQCRAILATTTAPLWGYANAFSLPADTLKVNRTSLDDPKTGSGIPWRIEKDQKLLTDATAVSIVYTARITDPNKWDVLLQRAVVAALAMEFAIPITQDGKIKELMAKEYAMILKDAYTADGQEASPEQIQFDPSLADVRL